MLRFALPLQLRCHHQPSLPNLRTRKPFNPPVPSSHRTASRLRASYPVRSGSISPVFPSPEDELDVELGRLLALLPEEMRRRVSEHPELHQLMEVVMDLGRKPLARFPSGDFVISEYPITVEDIGHATAQVGDFAVDNRAGISRTLHRISAIRNRKGAIIGLTCRVGRAISGSAKLLQDLVQDGASLLLIGPPGVGKTTIIREIARMLANDYKKRVMIVDTSNEIGGDGDIPHAGIGSARRMQVPNSDMQHKVLIEAVENHMPQVIVIDEIGTKLEAMAASTIAQRGIQLVATAHGVTIENLIMNPSLEMLVGGIQSVTLGDEEASRRGVQKTVLERKGPSTFSCGVEIISKTELRIHRSLEATVDAILSGRFPNVEVRKMKSQEYEEILQKEPVIYSSLEKNGEAMFEDAPEGDDDQTSQNESPPRLRVDMVEDSWEQRSPLSLFCYGILEATVMQGIKHLKMNDAALQLTDNISEANALLALQSKLKKNPRIQAAAKSHGIPIYVTKTCSLEQVTKAIQALVSDHEDGLKDFVSMDKIKQSEKLDALEEARMAIEHIVIPKGETVDLLPRSPYILSLQLDLVRKYQLEARRISGESDIHLQILPSHYRTDEEVKISEASEFDGVFDDLSIGLSKFLDFAFENGAVGDRIRCLCPKCGFLKWQIRDVVHDHLLWKPFPVNYVIWNLHGEKQVFESSRIEDVLDETCHHENPMETLVNDAFGHYRQQANNESVSEPLGVEALNEGPMENHSFIDEFLKDGNQKLYEGSKYTKLEFIIKLYHIKVLCGLSDKAMTMILDLLRDAFEEVKLPPSVYDSKKIINKLGLNYTKIDACPNDCMLYLGDDEKDLDACKHCHKSRWKPNKKNKVAAKVLRYFPLKPRLQRLFRCCKTAEHMRWHALESTKDGLIRHPRDGEAWKTFDLMHPEFASDPRNVRLGLATDGFNPFGTLSSTYSIWPVFLSPYNLPPWMCMKHTSFILSMIIPGKHTPGNNIDVYLRPLVEELKDLWNGVETFDSSSNATFRMRAALMWTISDFPGLGILSGWNTHTGLACPTCNFDAEPCRLPHSSKWCFMGHRRFLSRNHRFRLLRVRFDGSTEERNPPSKLSGSDVLRQVENINTTFGKGAKMNGAGKRSREEPKQWNKRSIFFELPYWEFNLLRH